MKRTGFRLSYLAWAALLVLVAGASPIAADTDGSIEVTGLGPGAAERSGLQVGDRLQGWSRESPASDPVTGELASPFILRHLEAVEAALGTVTLTGTRAGAAHRWRMPSAPWGVEVRPGSADDAGPLHRAWALAESAAQATDEGRHEQADAAWGEAIAAASQAADRDAAIATSQLYDDWAAAHERRGDLNGALERLQQASRVVTAESLEAAHLLTRRAALERRLGDLDAAGPRLEAALAIRERLAPGGLTVAASHYELLLLARTRGDLDAAEASGKRALEIQEADDAGSLATARTRSTLGQIALMRGDAARAGELFLASYETLSVLAPGSRDLGSAATNLGILARQQGDQEIAMARFAEALPIFERLSPGGGAVAMLHNNLGVVAYDYGDLVRSERHLARALSIHERTAPDSPNIALYLDNLAGIARERGDMVRAENLYRRALAKREAASPGSLGVAATLGNLGNLLHERGDLERAEVYYDRALVINRDQAPGGLQEAGTLSDLGALAERRGDLALAEQRFGASLAIQQSHAPDSLGVAGVLSSLASVESARGEHAKAKELAERALAIRESRPGTMLHAAGSLYQLGRLAQRRGDAAEAVTYQRRAIELRQEFAPDSHWVASAWNGLGEALRMSGRAEASRDALCRATGILDRNHARVSELEEGRASFRALLGDYYRDCIGALASTGRPEEAFDALERFRARWLLAMLAERDVSFGADVPPELALRMRRNRTEYDRILAEMTRLDPGEDAQAAESLRQRTVGLRDEREQLAKVVRELSPRLADLQYPEPLTLDGARASLPQATLLLSYSVGAENTLLFAVRRSGAAAGAPHFKAISIPVTRAVLSAEVRALRDAIEAKAPVEDLVARSAALYDRLVRPAEALMGEGDTLLISPDGPLNVLPFGALVRRRDGKRQFLVEWRAIHFAVSASVHAQLARPLRPRKEGEPELVAFGDPDYGTAAPAADGARSFVGRAKDLRPLPHARDEVQGIASLFDDTGQVHLGAEATESRAKSLAERIDYVHFACHGFLDERFPLGSSLALSLPREDTPGGDNGYLQAWEIIEQVRLEADLVTLSACQTGLGAEMGGEGLVGLVRAFQHAGARSVVASLWSVADRPTADLMQLFYRFLREGRSKAEALRAAQIALLRGERPESAPDGGARGVRRLAGKGAATRHPFHWASFQLFGAE